MFCVLCQAPVLDDSALCVPCAEREDALPPPPSDPVAAFFKFVYGGPH